MKKMMKYLIPIMLISLFSCKKIIQKQEVYNIITENELLYEDLNTYYEYDYDRVIYIEGYNGWFESKYKNVFIKNGLTITFLNLSIYDDSPYSNNNIFSLQNYKERYKGSIAVGKTEYYKNQRTKSKTFFLKPNGNNFKEFDLLNTYEEEGANRDQTLTIDSVSINGQKIWVFKWRTRTKNYYDRWIHPQWGLLLVYTLSRPQPISRYLVDVKKGDYRKEISMYLDSIQLKYYHRKPFRMEGKVFGLNDTLPKTF